MDLRESELPGIGRKYSLRTRSGEQLVIVVHNDERRDIFHMDTDEPDEMRSMVTLDDEEARVVSAIIAGITYKPKFLENQEIALDSLVIEWIRLEPLSKCVGKRIGELDIRKTTGATILAIVEKDKTKHINPGAEYAFTSGVTLVVAGERIQLNQLKKLLLNGAL
ncbi:cation:proton antiporter regulatory subunit [Paenibacillus sp. Leaf72]|uniref:cation:proton antiporter regulatory subunit n=1 Tax=Paenibacillus sp. Leaf72 TaxID=1736234 RepID=UPI0006FA7BA4|nr:cation:proton antiporter regulatory subunit [Paenibacillus sp. Leaf72]KQN96299.1 potassium:proton antiporter [Paenibacillus sp. Leaf72]